MAEESDDRNERTEDPTPKRLEEAIRRGDVVKSAEVNTWFMIAGGTLMIMVFAAPMATSLQATFRGLLAKSYQIRDRRSGPGRAGEDAGDRRRCARSAFRSFSCASLRIAGNFVQHRLVFSAEPIKPQFSRISPAAGCGAAVFAAGARQFRQGPCQAWRRRRGHGGAVVAAAPSSERSRLRRSDA